MRILYIGMDNRARVTEITRIKFFPDGFKPTDQRDEIMEELQGPAIVLHTVRAKGGKRLILQTPSGFDMPAARRQILESAWLDLSACRLKTENLYY